MLVPSLHGLVRYAVQYAANKVKATTPQTLPVFNVIAITPQDYKKNARLTFDPTTL